VNIYVMHCCVFSSNPAVNAMVPIDQPLRSFIFCNDYRTAKILALCGVMAARQCAKGISRPPFPARLNLMPLNVQMGIGRPFAGPNALRQQSVENVQRISIAPFRMAVSPKALE